MPFVAKSVTVAGVTFSSHSELCRVLGCGGNQIAYLRSHFASLEAAACARLSCTPDELPRRLLAARDGLRSRRQVRTLARALTPATLQQSRRHRAAALAYCRVLDAQAATRTRARARAISAAAHGMNVSELERAVREFLAE